MDRLQDIDPLETREWVDSLDSVLELEGAERAHFILEQLVVVEEAGRGRDSGDDTDAVLGRGGHQIAARILLEQVVDGLDRSDVARRDCAEPFVTPTDRRPEGDPVMPDLAL